MLLITLTDKRLFNLESIRCEKLLRHTEGGICAEGDWGIRRPPYLICTDSLLNRQ